MKLAPHMPVTQLKIYGEDGTTLLELDFATGEVFVAVEDRMPEAAQIFWKNVRILMGQ